jgi:putative membrane protein
VLTAGSAVTSWTFDPLAVALVIVGAAWYARAVRGVRGVRRHGERWPARRTASFVLGLASIAAVTLWWVGAYAHVLFWVYTVQIMVLLVISPALLMFGRPITLARAARLPSQKPPLTARIVDTPALRLLSSPAFGPLLLPLVTGLFFFTAVLPASLAHYAVYELVHLILLVAGLVIALPLAGEGVEGSSLSIAAGILFGFLELLADAVPGIAIRLRSSLLAPEHYLAVRRTWGPSRLHDQQLGGAIVWFLAETIDLPVVALLVVRWIRADEREAFSIDQQLDRLQLEGLDTDGRPADPAPALQRPWWESDAGVFGDRRAADFRRAAQRGRQTPEGS